MTDSSVLPTMAAEHLRALGAGNGLLASEIEIIGATSADYTVPGESSLQLKVFSKTSRQPGVSAGSGKDATTNCRSFAELAKTVADANLAPSDWVAAVEHALGGRQGLWGFEGEIPLPSLTKTLVATEACKSCQGQGRFPCNDCYGQGSRPCPLCRQQRRIPCRNCHASGHNPADPQGSQPCPICHGQRTEICPQCNGQSVVKCPTCHGAASLSCQDCRGSGRMSELAVVDYIVTLSFGLLGNQALPQSLIRAIDRGGIAALRRGHATITAEEPEIKGAQAIIRLNAQLPFSEAQARIAGKVFAAQILGHKAAIQGLPPFLDKATAVGIAALRQTAGGHRNLSDILRYRALRDAVQIVLRYPKGADLAAFIKLYPVGFSRVLVEEILALTRQVLRQESRRMRWVLAGAVVTAFIGFCWFYYNGALRSALYARWPSRALDILDIGYPVAAIALLWYVTQIGQQRVLRRKFDLGKAVLPVQQLGRSFFVFSAIMLLIWGGFMLFGAHAPDWIKLLQIEYQAGILFDR